MKLTIAEITNNTKNTTNAILAKPAATDAIPPKPNIAATIAITKNITVQYNIMIYLNYSFTHLET